MSTKITAVVGQQHIIIERDFEIKRELVFEAFSKKNMYEKWASPENGNIEVENLDCVAGGTYLFHHVHNNGSKFSFYGVFHEVIYPCSMVRTSEFRGLPEKLIPVIETYDFKQLKNGHTYLTISIYCPSEAYRDGMLQSGMKSQFDNSFHRLDLLLTLDK